MRNKINIDKLKNFIESKYSFEIKVIEKGPRGFVAETFIIRTQKGEKYFVKVSEIGGYARYIAESAPVLTELSDLGLKNITVPIKAKDGALFYNYQNHILIVFNFIEGKWSFECDFEKVVNLLAMTHKLTPRVKSSLEKEDFTLPLAERYLKHFHELQNLKSENQHEKELSQIILTRKDRLIELWGIFTEISETCRSTNFNWVITHGDAIGNTMDGDDGQVYIFDWDETILAPAERDNWFLLDSGTREKFLSIYRNHFPEYEPNENAYQFYVLRRYFDDIEGFVIEILNQKEDKYKAQNLKELYEIFDWLHPVIDEFI